MCGRYEFNLTSSKKSIELKERIEKLNLHFTSGEIFPSNKVLCVIGKENKIDLSSMTWGIKKEKLLINARIENIDERITYKNIKNNRCAVVCNGFYEWDKDKQKHYISFNEEYMYLACIYNSNNELVILTKDASKTFSHIHSRMPIIMNQEEMIKYVHNIDDVVSEKDMNIKKVNEDLKLF